MEMFVVAVESTSRDLSDSAIDHAMTALAEWHPSVGASLAGTLEATLTLPGEDLRQAVAAGVTAVTAAGLVPIAVSALPEKVGGPRRPNWPASVKPRRRWRSPGSVCCR